uniref:Uncharacterized protein n=1 Tax=Glossina palpalis gambiensis TaxID=67801 RepID=A0A1B0BQG9_9MUSC
MMTTMMMMPADTSVLVCFIFTPMCWLYMLLLLLLLKMLHSSAIHQSRKSVGGSPSRARGNVRMHCGGLSKTIKWLVSQRGKPKTAQQQQVQHIGGHD